ncbi:Protein of unknown function DUF2921 [Macleaya cordata]|uniref:RING-type E3 ubiquitin transferase n=1 Tax=Macleaya cordata TaxID=56857 RepID=A0A200QB95_MACCD|nr:Protein of unknown function DUF2921 [Macleaya cordata]
MATTPLASSFSPLPKKSRVRVSSFSLIYLLLFFFLFFNIPITTSYQIYPPEISYKEYCNSIVPESISNDLTLSPSEFLQLQNGYYQGGEKFLSQSSFNFPKSLVFRTRRLYKTDNPGILKVEASLIFRGTREYPALYNLTYGKEPLRDGPLVYHRPRIPSRRNGLNFILQGFYSESSGKLCMVGTSSATSREGNTLYLSAVFKLNYPNNSTIFTSLVSGTLESLDRVDSSRYFEPISILAFSQRNYTYTLISGELDNGFSGGADNGQETTPSLSLDSVRGICSTLVRSANGFELEYGNDCDDAKNCNPLGRSIGFLPNSMSFSGIQCSDKGRLRLLIGFSDGSYFGYNQPLVPNTTLVGEGVWDGEKNRLCVVACRILNFMDSLANASVGDCSIRLSLRFPAILSIRNRSSVVGQIWSNGTTNGSGYFDRVSFRGSENRMLRFQGLRYEYTETGSLMKSCPKKISFKNKEKTYPNGYSSDMRFDMTVKDDKGKRAWGYSVPLSVGDEFYENSFNLRPIFMSPGSAEVNANHNHSHSRLLNVSYRISFTPAPDFSLVGKLSSTNISFSPNKPFEIAAEGIYDTKTGGLCMVGCRNLWLNHQKSTRSDSMDCDILINVQFPPLNAKKGETVKGSIESTRGKTDHLYFQRLELSSTAIYTNQARESIWRMDLEITMVLISNTLACVFIGLQLFFVKKHPDVIPSISLVMLVILTLGHMIPLVLNFEALFLTNRNRQNVLIGSGGWLEVNEVIVRVVTMVAFLLQFRLLQLTWSTRLGEGTEKGLLNAEKNTISVSLPLYIIGGLIALMIHWFHNHYAAQRLHGRLFVRYQRHSLLGDLRSYAGLVLDSFLFPQIMLNIFWNSKDKALSPAFYVGTSVVRLLPHAYDLYRAHSFVPSFDVSIYANPGADFFSTAWDVIITCVGLLFAGLIYFQQRFGGRCILPKRFRQLSTYEKVPIDSGEGL